MFSKAVLETRRPWSQAFKSLLKINISILECHIQPPINQRGHRGWGGRMASSTQRTRVWTNSRRPWRTGKPGVLQSMRSQRVGRDWTELNWWILSVTILLWCFSNDDFIFHSILPHLLLGILLKIRTVPTPPLTYSIITIYPYEFMNI